MTTTAAQHELLSVAVEFARNMQEIAIIEMTKTLFNGVLSSNALQQEEALKKEQTELGEKLVSAALKYGFGVLSGEIIPKWAEDAISDALDKPEEGS